MLATVYVYHMQVRCTGPKKQVEQNQNDSLWLCVVLNSHSRKDCPSYSKVKDTVIACALLIFFCL